MAELRSATPKEFDSKLDKITSDATKEAKTQLGIE